MKSGDQPEAFRGGFIVASVVAVFVTFLLHEFSHWLTGEWLGNEMTMSFNSASPKQGIYAGSQDFFWVSLAGPVVTLLQALIVSFLMMKRKFLFLYPFLIAPLVMRILAGVMNAINPNDEGRVSLALGLGLYTVPILMCVMLLILVRKVSVQWNFKKTFNGGTVVLIIVFESILIMGDQWMKSLS